MHVVCVGLAKLAVVARTRSPRSTILVSGADRTIVHYPGTVPAPTLSQYARELCAGAAWVHADQAGYAATRGLDARVSLDGGNPIEGLDGRSAIPTLEELQRSMA